MAEELFDLRGDPKRPVFRVKMEQFTWAVAATAAVAKGIPVCGRTRVIIGVGNDVTNAITYTTTISEAGGATLYTKADWAEAATEKVQLDSDTEIYIPPGSVMTVTPSGAPGGTTAATFDITLIGV